MAINADRLREDASSQRGKPYKLQVWKAEDLYQSDPPSFDCSKYTMWLLFRQGFKIPAWTGGQIKFCIRKPKSKLQVGDLLFFGKGAKEAFVNHVGIYIGSGMVAHAAGGRADKVIFDHLDKQILLPTFIGFYEVPLEKAEDRFFKWISKNPNPSEACKGEAYGTEESA